jgi:hypothetical protein
MMIAKMLFKWKRQKYFNILFEKKGKSNRIITENQIIKNNTAINEIATEEMIDIDVNDDDNNKDIEKGNINEIINDVVVVAVNKEEEEDDDDDDDDEDDESIIILLLFIDVFSHRLTRLTRPKTGLWLQ